MTQDGVKKTMFKPLLVAAIALVVGLVIGFLLGRAMLERSWSQPYTQALPPGTKGELHNPSPPIGSKVLRPMPIGRVRATLRSMTERDPVTSEVASVGAGDGDFELHVVVENRGTCTVTSLAGVAYGFDASGMPAALNAGGETYVAFETKAPLPPGRKLIVAEELKGVDGASLALAHVDHTTCADGTSWTRQ